MLKRILKSFPDFVDVHIPEGTLQNITSIIKQMKAKRSKMAVEITNQEKRKEQLMKTFQNYNRQHIMFQKCPLRMLRDHEDIIRKQRETIEKKKHQLRNLKQKHTKTTEELEKKKETTKQTEETKKKFRNPLPTLQRQEI